MRSATVLEIVGVGERGEASAKGLLVEPAQRVVPGETGEVDVVVEEHDVANLEGGVEAAGGVGDDEGGDVEDGEDASGEGDGLDVEALVEVNAADHDHDGGLGGTEETEGEAAGVADDCVG